MWLVNTMVRINLVIAGAEPFDETYRVPLLYTTKLYTFFFGGGQTFFYPVKGFQIDGYIHDIHIHKLAFILQSFLSNI